LLAATDQHRRATPAQGARASNAHFDGGLDADGHARACPQGSSPHVRPGSRPEVAKRHAPPMSPTVSLGPDYEEWGPGQYAWVQGSFLNELQSGTAPYLPNRGGTTTTTIAYPQFPTDGSQWGAHSVSQLWLTSNDPTTQLFQTIEVGWEVEVPKTGAAPPPYLFVFSTMDNYGPDSCSAPSCGAPGPVWIPNGGSTPSTIAPNATLEYTIPGGTQHEMTMTVEQTPAGSSWTGWSIWVSVDGVNDTLLGYFEKQPYGAVAAAQGATQSLAVQANDFKFGGEVTGDPDTGSPSPALGVNMGEEAFLATAVELYGIAAYHRNYGYFDTNGTLQQPPGYVWNTNKEYVYNVTAAAPPGNSVNWFYFGDRAGTPQSQALLGNDFDGDGIADMASSCDSTFCGTEETSMLLSSYYPVTNGSIAKSVAYGAAGPNGLPVPRDYDGDGKSDPAVWNVETGLWTIFNSSKATTQTYFGIAGDIPVPADYDGDGYADVAVWRPTGFHWYLAGASDIPWGYVFGSTTADIPVPGDYDGDRKTDLAYFTTSGGQGYWHILPSGGGATIVTAYGIPGDIPVPADYDGDGRTDVAVYRPSLQQWFIRNSASPEWRPVFTTPKSPSGFGGAPVPADYDGDGATDVAYWDGTGEWDTLSSATQAVKHVAGSDYYETQLPYFR
jgi:FG-GAP-like repeat